MIEDLESDIKFKNNKWTIIDPRYKSVTICSSKQKEQFQKIISMYNIKTKNIMTNKGRKTSTKESNMYRKKICEIIENDFKKNNRIFYLM